MPGRPTICSHGTPLYNSWRDCPDCVEEMERDYQTQLLEKIANNNRSSSSISSSAPQENAQQQAKANFFESQEMALLAEERFRINDLLGAVELINKAIQLESSFVSFYYQRARYFFLQGKKEQAISDLHNFFKANPENFVEVVNQLKVGKLAEFSAKRPEFEAMIQRMWGKRKGRYCNKF